MTDYEWGSLKPGEVARQGRAAVTSSPSRPTAPSGMRLDIGRFRGDVTVAASKKAEAAPAVDAGVKGTEEGGCSPLRSLGPTQRSRHGHAWPGGVRRGGVGLG